MLKRIRQRPDWVLVALAAILRFVNIGQESLWYDESFTAMVAQLPIERWWIAIRGDNAPPAWYAIEWLTVRLLGNSEIALRLPAALLGILAVWLIYRIAISLDFTTQTASVAGLIAAISPAAIYYSQEARQYSLLACCVLAFTWAGLNRRWLLFTLAGIGTVYSQNLGVFYVVAIGLAVLYSVTSGKSRIKPIVALGSMVLVWLPWAVFGLRYQISNVSTGFWIPPFTVGAAVTSLPYMTVGWRTDQGLELHMYAAAVAITLVGLVVARHWLLSRKGLIVVALIFGGPALIALASILWRNVYINRPVLPSAIALAAIWAYGLVHLAKPNRRIALAVVAPVLAIALVAHYFPVRARNDATEWRVIISTLHKETDVIYHISLDSAILSRYYLAGLPQYIMPEANDLAQSLTEETKAAAGFNVARFEELRNLGFERAWLIYGKSPMLSQAELDYFRDIEAHYHLELLSRTGNDLANSSIYLVDLQ